LLVSELRRFQNARWEDKNLKKNSKYSRSKLRTNFIPEDDRREFYFKHESEANQPKDKNCESFLKFKRHNL
jgi:hypothetical protein